MTEIYQAPRYLPYETEPRWHRIARELFIVAVFTGAALTFAMR